MSKKIKAGKAKHKSAGFSVAAAGGDDLVKRLRKLETGGKVAIQRTVSDFASRAPGWVSQGVREHYGVDTAAIKDATKKPSRGKTSIKVAGVTVDGVTLEYSGRLLTPTHFKMKPAARPPSKKTYRVSAEIIKGKRTNLHSRAFLGRAGGEGTTTIPWQRVGDGRRPVHVIKTVSVPQMIDGRAKETINEKINENLEKRFNNQIKRIMK